MFAPTPVSSLLHDVSVVKAGVFCLLKIVVYVFGLDLLETSDASMPIIWVAAATMLLASFVAILQDNLKFRLAYSTVSQLAYIVLGAAIATSASVVGASLHLATHAVGKSTLCFCAGAIYTACKKTLVSELNGKGRIMPFTLTAYTIAAISIIGLPPRAGSLSKWFLVEGAVDAGMIFIAVAYLISTLLNIIYLLPIATNAFLKSADGESTLNEAPIAVVLPLCVTASLCLILFFMMPAMYDFLIGLV